MSTVRQRVTRFARVIGVPAVVLALGAGAVVAQASERPAAAPGGADSSPVAVRDVVYLMNLDQGRCLEITKYQGLGPVTGRDCTDSARQRWERIERGDDTFVLRNVQEEVCVRAIRSAVIQAECDFENTEQHWTFVPGPGGRVGLKNVRSGRAATLVDDELVAWPENGEVSQRFLVSVEVPSLPVVPVRDVVQLKNVALGRCVEHFNDGTSAGVAMRNCTDAAGQRWERIETGDNTFVLRNVLVSQCLRGDAGFAHVSRCDLEKLGQQWTFVPAPGGTVQLKNVQLGGVADTLRLDGSKIFIEPSRDHDFQRFEVIEVARG